MTPRTLTREADSEPPTLFRGTLIALILAGWLAALLLPWEFLWRYRSCPFFGLTGIPCPFCRMTHACVHAVRGQLGQALIENPLGPVLMLLSLGLGVYLLVKILRRSPPSDWDSFLARVPWLKPILFLILGLNWTYLIVSA